LDVNYVDKGEGSRPCSVPRATSSARNAFPSDFPMNTSSGEPEVPPIECSSACALEHLTQLVFEIHRDMENMKFSMEMMNQHISWLVASAISSILFMFYILSYLVYYTLHASEALRCLALELSAQDAIMLHVPVPLPMSG
jgi:hypothetical protein